MRIYEECKMRLETFSKNMSEKLLRKLFPLCSGAEGERQGWKGHTASSLTDPAPSNPVDTVWHMPYGIYHTWYIPYMVYTIYGIYHIGYIPCTSTGRQGRLIGSLCWYICGLGSFFWPHLMFWRRRGSEWGQTSPPLQKRQYYCRGVVKFKIVLPTLHEKHTKKRFLRSMGSIISHLTTPLTK